MLKVGDAVDRYVIEAAIGEGGMGRVYRALDPKLGRRVALKVLLAEGSDRQRADAATRMVREARSAAAFSHPNVVAIYDVGEVEGSPYIAMELVNGRTLRERASDDRVSDAKKISWLLDVARGLAAAHRAGLVHRDIKPDNVMVTTDGVVKILDFGIARRADSELSGVDVNAPTGEANLPSLTADGQIIGTPQYMAPEQLRGEPLDGRCDQFAWGVMAWELLAGKSPWGRPTHPAMLITAVLSADPPPLAAERSDLSVQVTEAIARSLAKRREERFGTTDDLVAALDGAEGFRTPDPALRASEGARPLPLTPDPGRARETRAAVANTLAASVTELEEPPLRVLTARAPGPVALVRMETASWLLAGLLLVFAVGYADKHRGIELIREGGLFVYALPALYAVAAVGLLRGRAVRWLPVLIAFGGTFATYMGLHATRGAVVHAGITHQVFRVLHEGLLESNVGRFVGFALAASLILASLRVLPPAAFKEQAVRRVVAAAFAYALGVVAFFTRLGATVDGVWSRRTFPRADRVAFLVAAGREERTAMMAFALVAVVLALLASGWVRRLPGPLSLRGVLASHSFLALAVVVGVALDETMSQRFQSELAGIYAAFVPELTITKDLDPPEGALDLAEPPVAPTLKLARDRVSIDVKAVGMVNELGQGDFDAILLGDLSHRLAEASAAVEPPLLVMADRSTSTRTLVAGLRVARRAGVTRVGLLHTRGAPPVLHDDDPPEAAYVVPGDFGMKVASLAYCAAFNGDWTTLATDGTLCVGPSQAPSEAARGQAAHEDYGTSARTTDSHFPCRETVHPLLPVPERNQCPPTFVGWCTTEGRQSACCPPDLVAGAEEGTCECPAGGVVVDGPPSKCPRAETKEGLPAATVQAVVRANFGKMKLCHEAALKRKPTDQGRVQVAFEIGPDGRVFFARIHATELTDREAEACVLAQFQALTFPPPAGGRVTVDYPIIFGTDP